MQSALALGNAPESFSFFRETSSSLLESAADPGSQQTQQFVQKGAGKRSSKGAQQEWSPRAWSAAPTPARWRPQPRLSFPGWGLLGCLGPLTEAGAAGCRCWLSIIKDDESFLTLFWKISMIVCLSEVPVH